MRKIFLGLFILSFVVTPAVSHAGLFDFLRSNQSAQIRATATTNTTAGASTTATYRRGDRAEAVLQAQQALSAAGLYAGDLSGLIGPRTEAAIRTWQTNNRLPATGVLDAVTLRSIVGRSTDNQRGGGNGFGIVNTACAPGDMPWIKVKKPNGGETYVAGENVKVQWDSCNIPPGVDIGIDLYNQISVNPQTNAVHNLIEQTPNDGIQEVSLNPQTGMTSFVLGNNFKIELHYVVTNDYDYNTYGVNPAWMQLNDLSDNFFTIGNQLGGGGSANGICNMEVLYPYEGAEFQAGQTITSLIEISDYVPGSCGWTVFECVAGSVELENTNVIGWFNDPINASCTDDLMMNNQEVYFSKDITLPSNISVGNHNLIFTEEPSGTPPVDTFEMSIEIVP